MSKGLGLKVNVPCLVAPLHFDIAYLLSSYFFLASRGWICLQPLMEIQFELYWNIECVTSVGQHKTLYGRTIFFPPNFLHSPKKQYSKADWKLLRRLCFFIYIFGEIWHQKLTIFHSIYFTLMQSSFSPLKTYTHNTYRMILSKSSQSAH